MDFGADREVNTDTLFTSFQKYSGNANLKGLYKYSVSNHSIL